jgi:hypothetical protein
MKQAFWHFTHSRMNEATGGEAPASTGGGTFDSVAEAVAELDRRDSVRREEAKAAKAAEAQPQEVEEVSPDPSEPAEEIQPDPDESEFEDEDVAPEEEAEPEPDKPVKAVEFGGKQLELPAGTPLAVADQIQEFGRSLNADYTRKTQAVAQEAQRVQAATQQTAQFAQHLQQAQAALAQFAQATLGEPPGLDLAQADPQTYLVQRALYEQRANQFNALLQQGQQLTQHQSALHERQMADFMARETSAMFEHIPELKSEGKRREFMERAVKVAGNFGISPQEVANFTDHRMIRILDALMKAQGRERVSQDVKKHLANVPPKAAKPGVATTDAGTNQRKADAKRRFMSGQRSMRDVERYLRETE